MDRGAVSCQEPGGPLRVDARSGARSRERTRSSVRVDRARADRHSATVPSGQSRRESLAWPLVASARARDARPGRPPDARATRPAGRPVRFTLAPPTDVSFTEHRVDALCCLTGRKSLAFTGIGPEEAQLWLRSFDLLVSRPLPGTEGALGPFWSPDGLVVAFFADNRLKRVALSLAMSRPSARPVVAGRHRNRDGAILLRRRSIRRSPASRRQAGPRAADGARSGTRGQGSHGAGVPSGWPALSVRADRRPIGRHLRGLAGFAERKRSG